MPLDLGSLLDPARTAVVTSECQNGVLGPAAIFPQLASAAADSVIQIERLVSAARTANVQVVHCLALRRPDGKGANANARLFAAAGRAPVLLEPGSAAAALLPSLGPDPGDLVLTRLHGLSPMAGTDLDAVLRNLGVTTLVVAGVSVNVAITNLVMDAVNLGYQVVLPRDAVAGTPAEYADAVIDNTLSLLATVTTVDDVVTAWTSGF
jgi:nicotinamidase-related amidase